MQKHLKMKTQVIDNIYDTFKGKPIFDFEELFDLLKTLNPEKAAKTISWQMSQLKSKGLISHSGRGFYSLNKKMDFSPEILLHHKRIFNKIKKEFPLIEFCIWDSRWFNEFMIHQLFRYYLVIETEKESTDAVFNFLTDLKQQVFLNPNGEIFKRYINNCQNAIIVKSLPTESPLLVINNFKIPSLEKLLVDCLAEKDLFAAQQDELDNIYQTAFQKYSINISKLKRYARRRNKLGYLQNKFDQLQLLS